MKKLFAFVLVATLFTATTFAKGWWVPDCKENSHKHEYHEYTAIQLCYEEDYEQPMFVSYCVTREDVNKGRTRKDQFAEDPNISTGSATLADYKKSGYDRGHLAPSADMDWDEKAWEECFYMSNMSPQQGRDFNQYSWRFAEENVRDILQNHEKVAVITGPVLKPGLPTIGESHVAVPEKFYKIAVFIDGDKITEVYSVIMYNDNRRVSKDKLAEYKVSIEDIEKITGLNFFPTLRDTSFEKVKELKSPITIDTKKSSSSGPVSNVKSSIPVNERAATKVLNIRELDSIEKNYIKTFDFKKNSVNDLARALNADAETIFYYIGRYADLKKNKSFKVVNGKKTKTVKYTELADKDILLDYLECVKTYSEAAKDFNTSTENLLINIGYQMAN